MTSKRRLAAVPDAPRLAVISLRVSRTMGRDGDSFHAPDLQEEACRRFCAERGWVVVGVVSDLDVSGGVFDRPGLNQALAMLQTGEATALVTYDVSRLGRKVKETLDVIDRVRSFGAVYASVKERFDDTPEGEHLLHTFLSIAHLYRRQRGRGWQEVLQRRAERGRWHGSNPPLGYQVHPGTGLVIDEVLGPLMTSAFERYAAGHLVSHIARDLSDRRGKVLAAGTLKKSLRNPVYVGRLMLNGQEYPAVHEPLVDDLTWQRVQQRLERDARTPSRRLAISHSLVGLVVCDHCGYHLQLHTSPARTARGRGGALVQKEPEARLQCRQRLHGGPQICVGPGTPLQGDVEAAVLEKLPRLIERLQVSPTDRAAKQAARARAGVDVGRLRRELAKTEAAIATLVVDRGRREITQSQFQLGTESLERTVAALRAQLDDVQLAAESPAPRQTVKKALTLLALWEDLTVAEQNRGLRQILKQVRVRRALTWREPLLDRVDLIQIS